MKQRGRARRPFGPLLPRGPRHRSRGQSLVEFAVVIPVFLLVLCGILDFGFLLYARMKVIDASREGAQYGSTLPSTQWSSMQSDVATQVNAVANGLAMTVNVTCWTSVTTTPTSEACSSATAGDSVNVSVAYKYHTFFPLLFGTIINMNSTDQMVIYPPSS
ncbi:MAG: TadE/TadG family type IV pilus assembly protein [Candidatus Limnocylindrales bacterium]